MTQQNRVDPWGALHAVYSRGTLMGNRGILHDDRGVIKRRWSSPTWVTCVLNFRGRSSPGVFRPGHYSKLFFLDEATSFAAGHRPCGECQRQRYVEFKAAWEAANASEYHLSVRSIKLLDRQLHRERASMESASGKVTFGSNPAELPAGVLIEWAGGAWLVTSRQELRRWTFDGYAETIELPNQAVQVLTPISIVRTFQQGFVPQMHRSAGEGPSL